MNKNPYENLEQRAFWRPAIASKSPFDINDLWKPKFDINHNSLVATYGSCFAQHIGKSLRQRGYQWLITEQKPNGIENKIGKLASYDIFSSRTANIYTSSLLYQWISWATKTSIPPKEIWENNKRFYDPFRPAIEPNGFDSQDEVNGLRDYTIACFRKSIIDSNYFVFTMGLTESWWNKEGYEYPMCPGTVAGEYNAQDHYFLNQDYEFILEYMRKSLDLAKTLNPNIKFILTVSPVPLTATNSNNHVLIATMESKSILRAVAGKLAKERDDCDYFPSYEIINSPAFNGMFFEPNKRSVNPRGVKFVMEHFFSAISRPAENPLTKQQPSNETVDVSDTPDEYEGCEEAMLDVYGEI